MASPAVGPPKTLPANFFDKSGNPPSTLPANFFEKEGNAPKNSGDSENAAQKYIDGLTRIQPIMSQPGIMGKASAAFQDVGAGLLSPLSVLAHPIDTAESLVNTMNQGMSPVPNRVFQDVPSMQEGLAEGLATHPLGTLASIPGMMALGEVPDLPSAVGDGASAAREAAMGDPDAAALRSMRIPQYSKKVGDFREAVQGARPFLSGMKNVAEAQERIPAAKSEIWQPYQEVINRLGQRTVQGPDGPTTIGDLEAERSQLSALNRGLKSGDPSALQLAQQKGLSQAQLLDREESVKGALDPELEKAGINPKEIRKSFSQVSQVGSRLMGRDTLLEKNKPYGLQRLLNPFSNLTIGGIDTADAGVEPIAFMHLRNPLAGIRDMAAGRPMWSGKMSDVDLGEGFRPSAAGPKPEFGKMRLNPQLMAPGFDEANQPFGDWQYGIPNQPQVTPPPRQFMALPESSAVESEVQPMIGMRANPHPGVAEEFSRERITPTQFNRMERGAPGSWKVTPDGQVIRMSRGLLPGGFDEVPPPEETGTKVFPHGSQFRDIDEGVYHPPGSKFRKRGK